jgi:hypothetical protein
MGIHIKGIFSALTPFFPPCLCTIPSFPARLLFTVPYAYHLSIMVFVIAETPDHGLAAIATERLEPGDHGLSIMTEKALLHLPRRGSEQDLSGPPPAILEPFDPQIWTDWWIFCQQDEEIKTKVTSIMYVEMDCLHAVWLQNYLEDQKAHKNEQNIDDDQFDASILENIDDFVRFTMIIRFNSVELCPPAEDGGGPGQNFGHGLFEKACKMSHSCKPNCVWHTLADGSSKEIRVIAPIEEGEELTVDYVGCKLKPTHVRRKELIQSKGFLCRCKRCSRHVDDTRRFKCINNESSNCLGVHFLSQPTSEDNPCLLSCSQCNAQATTEYTEQVLEEEKIILEEVTELDHIAENYHGETDVSKRIDDLHPPHDLHSLAEQCYMLKGEYYSQHGDYELAAKYYAKQIDCRIAILGEEYYNETTAFCCERLGDALRHVNLQEAERSYQRTVRSLQMMRGGTDDPYTKCAVKKLIDVQLRIKELEHDEGEMSCSEDVVGLADPPDGPPKALYPCQFCGNESHLHRNVGEEKYHYCCDEHMRIHVRSIYHGQSCSSSTLAESSAYEKEALFTPLAT